MAISRRTHQMVADQYQCLLCQLEPPMAKSGVVRVSPRDFSPDQMTAVEQAFESEVFPIFTPMAIRPDAPFPLLINRALNICVRLTPAPDEQEPRFAIIPLGPLPRRILQLPAQAGYQFTLLEDVICAYIDRFFPGEGVLEAIPFRITRNAA